MQKNIQSTGKRKSNGNPNWKKGVSPNPSGRPKGKPNYLGKEVKNCLRYVFKNLGGNKAALVWAKNNQTPFYKEWFNQIPKEIAVEGDMNVNFSWETDGKPSNGPL